jgi:hypothetical protein
VIDRLGLLLANNEFNDLNAISTIVPKEGMALRDRIDILEQKDQGRVIGVFWHAFVSQKPRT